MLGEKIDKIRISKRVCEIDRHIKQINLIIENLALEGVVVEIDKTTFWLDRDKDKAYKDKDTFWKLERGKSQKVLNF